MICTHHPAVAEGIVRCFRCNRPFCGDCRVLLKGHPYCAACKNEQVRDIQSGVDATELDLASLGRRFAAMWIDGFIVGVPAMVVALLALFSTGAFTHQDEPPNMNWLFLVMFGAFVLNVCYEALMLRWRGQTLGKMALKIKVVSALGTEISGGQAWGRAVIRSILISYLALINYLPAFFTKEKTCVHDMAAKTRVVNWL